MLQGIAWGRRCCVCRSSLAVRLLGFGAAALHGRDLVKKGAVCADVWRGLKAFCFKPPQKQPPAAIFCGCLPAGLPGRPRHGTLGSFNISAQRKEGFLASSMSTGLVALHGNDTETLADTLMAWMRAHPLQPLEPEVVLVQSNGTAEWF